MTVYVLDTNTTGSGLDIIRSDKQKRVLVTDNREKYARDLNFSALQDSIVVDNAAFELSLNTGNWPHGKPTCIISNSDSCLKKAAEYSLLLDLPAPSPSDLDLYMNKHQFRQRSRLLGLPSPGFNECFTTDEALHAAGSMSFPLVVKPTYGTGSIGVTLCNEPHEVRAAAERALAYTRSESVLLEEFIYGPLYSAEIVIDVHGKITLLGFTNRELSPPPYFVETAYTFPVPLDNRFAQKLNEQIAKLHSSGSSMMMHVEFIIDLKKDNVVIVEINPRVGGGMLSRMISEKLRSNVFDIFISAWMQQPAAVPPSGHTESMSHFWIYASESGCVSFDEKKLDLLALPCVYHQHLYVKPGDRVEKPQDFTGPLLSLLIKSADPQLVQDTRKYLESYLTSEFNYETSDPKTATV